MIEGYVSVTSPNLNPIEDFLAKRKVFTRRYGKVQQSKYNECPDLPGVVRGSGDSSMCRGWACLSRSTRLHMMDTIELILFLPLLNSLKHLAARPKSFHP